VVRDHFETFRAEAARIHERDGLPRSSRRSFEGSCAAGFSLAGSRAITVARAVWIGSRRSRVKGRVVCPSCGGRRMADRAAHLVDHVFPEVPVASGC
jgi:hypothetical protein